MAAPTHFRFQDAVARHEKEAQTALKLDDTGTYQFKTRLVDCKQHEYPCQPIRMNLSNNITTSSAGTGNIADITPSNHLMEKFFCWDAYLPPPGSEGWQRGIELGQQVSEALPVATEAGIDMVWTRLLEVIAYGEVRPPGMMPHPRYFVEVLAKSKNDTFVEIQYSRGDLRVKRLELKASMILMCESTKTQWEVNVLG